MSVKTIQHNKITWHHIEYLDDEARILLEGEFKFHPLDIKDVKGEAEESKIDVYRNYLFLVLHFPVLDRHEGRIRSTELNVFLGKGFLITIQKGKFRTMRNMYFKIQNSAKFRKSCFGRDTGYLLYRILEVLYGDTKSIMSYISKRIRQLEDEIYSDNLDEETARRIAYLRRKILSMKRIYDPQLETIHSLSQVKTRFLPAELNIYFDDIDDHVERVVNLLDNQKYAMKDLLEVHDSLVSYTTNKVIKILTLISVGLLPLTLLAGIYGMNIELPYSGQPIIIWVMYVVLVAVIIGFSVYLKNRKLL